MKDNRASNATYLGPIIFGQIQPAPEDQYQPAAPMFVEQEPEQEPDAEELPDQDWAAQKTEYEL
jgi:hypothetical protein